MEWKGCVGKKHTAGQEYRDTFQSWHRRAWTERYHMASSGAEFPHRAVYKDRGNIPGV
jgi:hypothetical protein